MAMAIVNFSKLVLVKFSGDYSAMLRKETTNVNLKSSLKSLNSSLRGSLMSKDCGKTRPMSIFLRQTKFFILCVKPTFVVIDGSPRMRLTT